MYKMRRFHLRISKCFPHIKLFIHSGLPDEKYCLCFYEQFAYFAPETPLAKSEFLTESHSVQSILTIQEIRVKAAFFDLPYIQYN